MWFWIVGTAGTISSYDFEPTVFVQTVNAPQGCAHPVDSLEPPYQNPIQYIVDCIENYRQPEGPLSVEISRMGQQIVDSAVVSAREKRTVALLD